MSNTPLSSASQAIVFYGAGSMAEAIARGLIASSAAKSEQIAMFNRSNTERLKQLEANYGVVTAADAETQNELLSKAEIIVLAMKPKDAGAAIRRLTPLIQGNQLIVSIIAGLSIPTIQSLLGDKLPVARTMPNTSSTIGLGATGISFSEEVTPELRSRTLSIFEAVGMVSVIPEAQMEILTGVSGSGPAYVYYMMEAMIAAGIEGGLSPEQARELTVQTVLGAASMMKQTGEKPADLRKAITSPNGSTQAALEVLDQYRFTEAVKSAVHRSASRSQEMGAAIEAELA
ncbi:pyrroline-5-carboxylate reductase [Paenibacillus yonginensis]|uniref:Pyrroline-5-carboxylate reductase n=1 Tax=Paenibacillus yonginensis TaxID=1462996 RepID=A0A1B1N068_9BACL|nr:pyrroline-5-carboxylate reductase [Paenibacillus yonginensis]ANS74806.1 pyrroline-5-carboxylate reductase [Paenibacillus yonginensis]